MQIFSKNEISKITSVLKSDGVIAFPTETVYGLGVKIDSKNNFEKLVKIKERRPDKPFTLMFSNFDQIKDYIDDDLLVKKIIKKCMPGPLTIIVKAKENIPEYFDNKSGFIGLRMPDDKFVLEMIDSVGIPLFVPSCNKADQIPCKNTKEVMNVFSNEIDACVDGNCDGGVPSTIIKVENNEFKLIRQGKITIKDIKEKLKWK